MTDIFGNAGRRLETFMDRLGRLGFLLFPFLFVLSFLDFAYGDE